MDLAGIMDSNDIARVEQAIRTSNDAGQIQLQVVTIPSLKDEPIEEVSYQMVKAWKLGESKTDKGALLLVSQGDRKMRIEVGQGLEGAIPDVYAKRIISDVVIPYFKDGSPSQGIVAGVASILQLAANESGGLPEPKKYGARKRSLSSWINIAVIILFILFSIIDLDDAVSAAAYYWAASVAGRVAVVSVVEAASAAVAAEAGAAAAVVSRAADRRGVGNGNKKYLG